MYTHEDVEKEIFQTLLDVPLKFKDKDYTQESIRGFHAPAISLTKDNSNNPLSSQPPSACFLLYKIMDYCITCAICTSRPNKICIFMNT